MKQKLDKIFCLPTSKAKVYQAKGGRKKAKTFWQKIYSLFF